MKKENKIEKFRSSIPLIYIVLVCLGYLNKNLFYSQFEIEIINYLDIQELIFVFIPIGGTIIGVIFVSLIFILPRAIFNNEKEEIELESKTNKLRTNINNIKEKKIYIFISSLTNFYIFIIPLGICIYYILFSDSEDLYVIPINGIILLIIWLIIFTYKYKLKFSKNVFELRENTLSFLIFMQIIVFLIIYENFEIKKARKILKGNPKHYVSLKKGSNLFETNEDTLFFGETSKYIFFRSLENKNNIIYKKEDFEEIIFRKIK